MLALLPLLAIPLSVAGSGEGKLTITTDAGKVRRSVVPSVEESTKGYFHEGVTVTTSSGDTYVASAYFDESTGVLVIQAADDDLWWLFEGVCELDDATAECSGYVLEADPKFETVYEGELDFTLWHKGDLWWGSTGDSKYGAEISLDTSTVHEAALVSLDIDVHASTSDEDFSEQATLDGVLDLTTGHFLMGRWDGEYSDGKPPSSYMLMMEGDCSVTGSGRKSCTGVMLAFDGNWESMTSDLVMSSDDLLLHLMAFDGNWESMVSDLYMAEAAYFLDFRLTVP
jgi:hypothetical protein